MGVLSCIDLQISEFQVQTGYTSEIGGGREDFYFTEFYLGGS